MNEQGLSTRRRFMHWLFGASVAGAVAVPAVKAGASRNVGAQTIKIDGSDVAEKMREVIEEALPPSLYCVEFPQRAQAMDLMILSKQWQANFRESHGPLLVLQNGARLSSVGLNHIVAAESIEDLIKAIQDEHGEQSWPS